MAQCTCAFRLAHLNAAYIRGGAIKSRCGQPPGRGRAADKEDVIAGYLGLGASRGDLPAEHKDLEHCHPGFGADAELEVRSLAPSRPAMPVRTRCPPRLQVMRQLRGIDCSPLQKSTAWKKLMRQLGKLPDKFHRRAAEVAEKFSMHAYNSLTPSAQLEHSWRCTACPQDALSRELFGTAVLHGNPRGECLAAPPCTYVHCAWCVGAISRYAVLAWCQPPHRGRGVTGGGVYVHCRIHYRIPPPNESPTAEAL